MSNVENFENEGGLVEPDRDTYNYSPAAGLGNDTVEAEPVQEPADNSIADDGGEVELTLAPGMRGVWHDTETGQRFRRGQVVAVDAQTADRLLSTTRRGRPAFVRADS
jgi:hypothetical protein